MTDFSIDTLDLTDFHSDRLDAIDLSAADITAAQQLSQAAPAREQWSIYLNALAAAGLNEWLSQRQLAAQPQAANIWQVNGFRLCSVAAPEEDEVLLPQACLDREATACHLYVAVGVDEEYGQAYIVGSARYDQLKARSLATEDQSYRLPIDQLDAGSNQLLLTLRCADPALIPLPVAFAAPVAAPVAAVPPQAAPAKFRVGQWLNRQLDDLAAELAWVLLPPMAPQTVGLRSASVAPMPSDTFSQVLQTITQQGITISEPASMAYYDLPIGDPVLRLYAVVGQVNPTEWSLLVVLGQPDGAALPANLQLSVGDGQAVLVQESVEVARSQSYLYTQLIGEMDEGFQVTVTLPNGMVHVLPEFVFA